MTESTGTTLTVWKVYKSRFIYTQAFILVACAFVYWHRQNLPLALMTFGFLQLAAVYGAWMGKRLVLQIEEANRNRQHGPRI